jgi:uncharacterized membrane protein YraQ (UPF0718 family)
VAIVSFVCSIGNVPLAAVLWNGGISFGGVIAFIFADLLILPILNIYRKYYGTKMMLTLLGTFYAAMVAAGNLVELIFGTANLIPTKRSPTVIQAGISWNYTTWLNILFLAIAALLVVRFSTSGGLPMVHMMGGSPDSKPYGSWCSHHHQTPSRRAGHAGGNNPRTDRYARPLDARPAAQCLRCRPAVHPA